MSSKTTVESVLSTLSSEAVQVLESHYTAQARKQVAAEIAGGTPSSKPSRRTASKGSGKSRGRQSQQMTNDGSNRSASQWIRDFDSSNEGVSAKDVCEAGKSVGLNIEPSLVYNVRALAKKKAEASDEDRAKAEEAKKAKLRENAAKARAARAEKVAQRKAAEAQTPEVPAEPAKPAKKSSKKTEKPAESK